LNAGERCRRTSEKPKAKNRKLSIHETCAKSPNDPKLSDRGVRRGTCMAGRKAAAEAGAVGSAGYL
jgi:hypothetical protein